MNKPPVSLIEALKQDWQRGDQVLHSEPLKLKYEVVFLQAE